MKKGQTFKEESS